MSDRRLRSSTAAANAAKRRCLGNNEAVPEVSVGLASPSEEELDQKTLLECHKMQKKYIQECETVVKKWKKKFFRLEYYHVYFLLIVKRYTSYTRIKEQSDKYSEDLRKHKLEEKLVLGRMSEMVMQKEKLENIRKKIAEFFSEPYKKVRSDIKTEPAVGDPELNAALKRMPSLNIAIFNEMVLTPAKLAADDLQVLQWPAKINWDQYSALRNAAYPLSAECRDLDDHVQMWEERVEKHFAAYTLLQTNKEKISVYNQNPDKMSDDAIVADNKLWDAYSDLENLIRETYSRKAAVKKLKDEEAKLNADQKRRDALIEEIRQNVNDDFLKCTVCLEPMTNGEKSPNCPKILTSCGHSACAACMKRLFSTERFVRGMYRCPNCREYSSTVVTNWTIMKMIKPPEKEPEIEVITID